MRYKSTFVYLIVYLQEYEYIDHICRFGLVVQKRYWVRTLEMAIFISLMETDCIVAAHSQSNTVFDGALSERIREERYTQPSG